MLYPAHHAFGSLANLDKARIPEYDRAIQVVNNWIEEFFFDATVQPTQTDFLSVVIQRTCLALEFQPTTAHDIIKRSPWLANLPKSSPKRKGDEFVLYDFLNTLTRMPRTGITSGMLGVR